MSVARMNAAADEGISFIERVGDVVAEVAGPDEDRPRRINHVSANSQAAKVGMIVQPVGDPLRGGDQPGQQHHQIRNDRVVARSSSPPGPSSDNPGIQVQRLSRRHFDGGILRPMCAAD